MNDLEPIIIVDTREQTPLEFTRFQSEPGTLQSGDYSIKGFEEDFAIERKSLDDLVGSITTGRKRFERELHRLRGFPFKRLLVVGTRKSIESHQYHSRTKPQSVLASLNAFEVRYHIPIIFRKDEDSAAREVERLVHWYFREQVEKFKFLKK